MIELLGNHLWQSTLCVTIAGLLTLALRNNRAQVRYGLWLAASVKFLVPFAALMAIGGQFGWRSSAPLQQAELTFMMDAVSQPFSRPELGVAVTASALTSLSAAAAVPFLLLAVWLGGCAVILLTWWVRWRRVAASVRKALPITQGREFDTLRRLLGRSEDRPLHQPRIARHLKLVSSSSSLEPGVFGILKPVLLWPRQMSDRLDDRQVEAILAHELSHVLRRDNLGAAVHMVVQALFWFHPLVWWVGSQLVDERERACDEEVIRLGSEPRVYAESILKTCEACVRSPLISVAGVSGSNLKTRIEQIMRQTAREPLNTWRKFLIATVGVVAIAGPVVVGALSAPPLRAQSSAASAKATASLDEAQRSRAPDADQRFNAEPNLRARPIPTSEVVSVTLNTSSDRSDRIMYLRSDSGGAFKATNQSARSLIRLAYQLQDSQILGGPAWVTSDRFDIVAWVESDPLAWEVPTIMRTFLADRFKLTAHHETRERPVYALVLAKNNGTLGPRLRRSPVDCSPAARAAARAVPGSLPTCVIWPGGWTGLSAQGVTMAQLAANMNTPRVDRVVVDRTGLTGRFDLDLGFFPPADAWARYPIVTSLLDRLGLRTSFTAMQEQLGLKLESQTAPVDVLVIDSAERPHGRG